MIATLYRLPSWFASPDDKPSLELFNYIVSNVATSFASADTPTFPDTETIEIQTSLGDNAVGMTDAMSFNYIKYENTWYLVTKAFLIQSNPPVWRFTGTVDIYLTWLVQMFSEEAAQKKTYPNMTYFIQKHCNRFAWTPTTESNVPGSTTGDNNGWYGIMYEDQQYLLNIHPALRDIGKRPFKQCFQPTLENQADSYYYSMNGSSSPTYHGSIPFTFSDGTSGEAKLTIPYVIEAGTPEPITEINQLPIYPVMVGKATKEYVSDWNYNYLVPYFLCDVGSITSTGGSDQDVTIKYGSYSNNYNLVGGGQSPISFNNLYNLSQDYYQGIYALPLPTTQLIPFNEIKQQNSYSGMGWTPFSQLNGEEYLTPLSLSIPSISADQEIVKAVYDAMSKSTTYSPLSYTLTLQSSNNIFLAICNQGAEPFSTPISMGDLSNMEPALMNWYKLNIRLYGQDNLINPTNFNYRWLSYFDWGTWIKLPNSTEQNGMKPTTWQYALNQLMNYTTSFELIVSPPNIMITNVPYENIFNIYDNYLPNLQYGDLADVFFYDYTEPLFNNKLNIPSSCWNYNPVSDTIFSCTVKADIPTPSTSWANYMATNKNNYDTALNITYLMAEQAQQRMSEAKNSFIGSAASYANVFGDFNKLLSGSLGNSIANTINQRINSEDIAPETYLEQSAQYHYLATGKEEDMSRVSNMRVSSTSSLNVLNNTQYCMICECPPLYEQVYVVNYYALNGYIVNKWVPFYYWYNRQICNFVRIAFFCNTFYKNLAVCWRGKIDAIMNKGIRIWNVANVNSLYQVLDYDLVLIHSYPSPDSYANWENNPQDNSELNIMVASYEQPTATEIVYAKSPSKIYNTKENKPK